MISRADTLLSVVDMVSARKTIEITGRSGSGRSYLLGHVRSHFKLLGWNVVDIMGNPALASVPLGTLELSGIVGGLENSGTSTHTAFQRLSERLGKGPSLVLVDDVDWLDQHSLGVVSAASAQLEVPLLFSSLNSLAASSSQRGAVSSQSLITIELSPMGFAELKATLERNLSVRIDSTAMSRLYVMSGGEIGIAQAVLEAAKSDGRLIESGGMLRASESLWTPRLRPLARHLLSPLDASKRDALRDLAILGVCNLDVAARLMSREDIQELEERSYVGILSTASGHKVAVQPPLLQAYFRDQALPGHRAQLLESAGLLVSEEGISHDGQLGRPEPDPALIAGLVYELAQRGIESARQRWHMQQNLHNATQLLQAVLSSSSYAENLIDDLAEQIQHLDATAEELAEWAISYSQYLAHSQRKLTASLQVLTKAADELPEYEVLLRAHASAIQLELGQIPDEEPCMELRLEGLDERTRTQVLRARLLWLLIRGRVSDADALEKTHRGLYRDDYCIAELRIHISLAQGHLAAAADAIELHLNSAIGKLDAIGIRQFSFLRALLALVTKHYAMSRPALALATSLGVPGGERWFSSQGIAVLGACFVDPGGNEVPDLAALEGMSGEVFVAGLLPGQQVALAQSRLAFAQGEPETALRLAHEQADALWNRGATLAAVFLYLFGLQCCPDSNAWERVHERISSVDCRGIEMWREYVSSLLRHDLGALDAVMARAQSGMSGMSVSGLAEEVIRFVPRTPENDSVLSKFEELQDSSKGFMPVVRAALSARELEVARLIAAGVPNPKIAEMLYVSRRTVESHVLRLNKKTGATKRSDLRAYLISTGQWEAVTSEKLARSQ